MSDEPDFKCFCNGPNSLVDVIFVHGLTGDAEKTWHNDGGQDFWPGWLAGDLEGLAIYTLGYPAGLFAKWAKKEMDMFERAGNTLERFTGKGLGSRPIVFIAHSLGGILTKMILRKSCDSEDSDWKAISTSTRLVVFLSTPHSGAALASAIDILPFTSSHIKLLSNETGLLDDLNEHYRTFANRTDGPSTAVYFERHRTGNASVVVTKSSADPGVAGTTPVAVDKDHINICKPKDRDDIIYCGIKRHLQKVVSAAQKESACGMVGGLDDYGSKSDSDRRDLLQKLVDADREHEYAYANDAQNQFARRYLKTGLLTAAKQDHDNFLAEIETRFVANVYHPLICHGANDEAIMDAVQSKVINPLKNKAVGGTNFNAKAVLSGLYFLTEQCHIRWDKPK
jgi:hypothetical protein